MILPDRGRAAAEGLGRTEREIASEKAATLARIARTLESAIAEVHRAREAIRSLDAEEKKRAAEQYQALRRHALLYRWYLVVQREAVGLFHHADVDRYYPIPPA